jgi:hypothetical protein
VVIAAKELGLDVVRVFNLPVNLADSSPAQTAAIEEFNFKSPAPTDATAQALRDELEQIKAQLHSKAEDNKYLKEKLDSTIEQLAVARAELAAKPVDNTTKDAIITGLREGIARSDAERDAAIADRDAAIQNASELKATVAKHEATIAQRDKKIDTLHAIGDGLQQRIEELEALPVKSKATKAPKAAKETKARTPKQQAADATRAAVIDQARKLYKDAKGKITWQLSLKQAWADHARANGLPTAAEKKAAAAAKKQAKELVKVQALQDRKTIVDHATASLI